MMVALGNFFFRTRNFIFPFALLMVLLPGPRLAESDLAAALLGLAVAFAGQLVRAGTIGLVYIVRGGKDRRVYANNLVTEGVFAHCRNPLYDGNLLIFAGMAITSNSWTSVLVMVSAALFVYRTIVAAEENYLRGRFGTAFDEYCARVPRFLPDLSGIRETFAAMDFHWRRLVVKEYGTTFAWVTGWCAIVAYNLWRHDELGVHPWLVAMLQAVVAAAIVGWTVARYLKKSRRLVAD